MGTPDSKMRTEVEELYGNRVRARACGLLLQRDRLLMVNHRTLAPGDFWAPPGGGVNFAEPATVCLQREFQEETGLKIEVAGFLFACEFIKPPLHAIELFFNVIHVGGSLTSGKDPEMKPEDQIILSTKFLSWSDIQKMDPSSLHGIFRLVKEPRHIFQLTGYLKL